MSKMKKVILAGLLLATLLVLSRFLSIKTPLLVISFSFVPIMLSAIWLGPKYSTLIAALGDFIGAILFPFGTYFPGFTVSSALVGLIYGLFLYRKPNQEIREGKFVLKLVTSSILNLGFINILLTSLWLHLLYGQAYLVIIGTRIVTQVIMLPIQVIVIYTLDRLTRPIMKKYFINEN